MTTRKGGGTASTTFCCASPNGTSMRRERSGKVGSGRAASERGKNRRRKSVRTVRRTAGVREVRDPEHAPEPIPDAIDRRSIVEIDLDASHHRSYAHDAEALQRRSQIANEQVDEPGT